MEKCGVGLRVAVRVLRGGCAIIHKECAVRARVRCAEVTRVWIVGGKTDVLGPVFDAQVLRARVSPEFAGVPPRAPARRLCVRVEPYDHMEPQGVHQETKRRKYG